MPSREPLAAARNLGPATAAWLREVGIASLAEVGVRGVIPVCLAMRAAGHPVTFTGVLALQGVHWQRVPDEVQDRLAGEWRSACPGR